VQDECGIEGIVFLRKATVAPSLPNVGKATISGGASRASARWSTIVL